MMRRAVVVAIALAAACRGPKGEGPFADEMSADMPKIEQAMKMKFKSVPRVELRSRQQVRELLLQELQEPEMLKQLRGQAQTYKLLGLLPDTMNLEAFYVSVLTEQVMGFYDPKTKALYMVDDAPREYAGITLMHDFVHALQDQYVNLDSLQRVFNDDDRQMSIKSIIEGQAAYEQVFIMTGGNGNIATQLPGGCESIRSAIRDAQANQPIFTSAPLIIQESLLFPYLNGAGFACRYKERKKGQLLLDTLPVTTEQVMHDAAYFHSPRDERSDVTLPKLAGTIDENNFGEFGTRLYLFRHIRDHDVSIRAANGWDGDRYVLVPTTGGNALLWVSVWDTPLDAAEFTSAIDDVMAIRLRVKPALTSGGTRTYRNATRTVVLSSRNISGRDVVYYVEVPAGANPAMFDLSAVKVVPR